MNTVFNIGVMSIT